MSRPIDDDVVPLAKRLEITSVVMTGNKTPRLFRQTEPALLSIGEDLEIAQKD